MCVCKTMIHLQFWHENESFAPGSNEGHFARCAAVRFCAASEAEIGCWSQSSCVLSRTVKQMSFCPAFANAMSTKYALPPTVDPP